LEGISVGKGVTVAIAVGFGVAVETGAGAETFTPQAPANRLKVRR
jgi:hypothetical protein